MILVKDNLIYSNKKQIATNVGGVLLFNQSVTQSEILELSLLIKDGCINPMTIVELENDDSNPEYRVETWNDGYRIGKDDGMTELESLKAQIEDGIYDTAFSAGYNVGWDDAIGD